MMAPFRKQCWFAIIGVLVGPFPVAVTPRQVAVALVVLVVLAGWASDEVRLSLPGLLHPCLWKWRYRAPRQRK